jgi:hypothetical protein
MIAEAALFVAVIAFLIALCLASLFLLMQL